MAASGKVEDDDGWVKAAMEDLSLAAEVILSFKRGPAPAAAVPVRWGRRLPRSRPARCEYGATAESSKRKEGESSSVRCSPTTPLSWSGGGGAASPSTADGGFEESTSFSPSAPRSKGVAGETTSATTKKSRKRKTFAELKEEESLLLKEMIHLRKELTTCQATYKELSARNESLKRMKFGLNVEARKHPDEQEKSTSGREQNEEDASSDHMPPALVKPSTIDENPGDVRCSVDAALNHDRPVFLFDLNMMPPEEETCRMR